MMLWHVVISCLLVGQLSLVESGFGKSKSSNPDVFGTLQVDPLDARSRPWKGDQRTGLEKLNDFLIEQTTSTDPDVNLDIVLKSYKADKKNKVPVKDNLFKTKRLLLGLRTLTGENECSYYSYQILRANYLGIDPSMRAIIRNEEARRVDKILAPYINRRIKNCADAHVEKFEQAYSSLDRDVLERVNKLLDKAVDTITDNGRNDPQKLFDVATDYLKAKDFIGPEYIYNAMVDSVKGTPDEKYMRRAENERTGYPIVIREKFDKVFYEVVANPCSNFRRHFKEVFEPLLFDTSFGLKAQPDNLNLYDTLLKYQMCHFYYVDETVLKNVVDYVQFVLEPLVF